MSGDATTTIATMRDAARAMSSVTTSATTTAKALRTAIDALSSELSRTLAEIDETKSHEAEGASSIGTWARRELHQDAGTTRQMVRAASTFRDLPDVGEAARAGSISFEHVTSFTYALKHIGVDETRMIEEPLLEVAKRVAPSEFHAKVRQVRDTVYPDDLDKAWLKGMDKRDIRLARTGEGWHLTGFLDIDTGAKLNTILKNLSVPRDADDERPPSQRRMDALDAMCSRVLEHGLPADNGIRPHIFVTVEAETFKAMTNQQAERLLDLDLKPAFLEGFGSVGPAFLQHLMCGAELTPFLIKTVGRNTEVLDVGRSERLASPRQAKGIRLRQHGVCASPGCKHPISHNHHVIWWSRGGPTDLDLLVGVCRKCHTLIHAGRLQVTGMFSTGFTFTTARGSPVHARVA